MTIETKMLKPINIIKLTSLYEQVKEYMELKEFVDSCYYDSEIALSVEDDVGNNIDICVSYTQVEGIVKVLEKRMGTIEDSLNILGYTMQDESKEWQYHVNVLKGEDDE
ncbi:hypothetical protein [Streptococcus gallolyticus]|uniref:hypothetical protein n=1 Tax=Streptococcus gallolyticus TaxID=315405 RepID=UPI002284836F|nr:hypothetical protein [Streptococcus gallolyticus]MCY7166388.1 hypothetical protein [Streptococcus gallolyticus subsp. gallolyticus]MCY7183774.1 hypothetical protein [Streptococcus gallolyticus subsp. gallolyticus]